MLERFYKWKWKILCHLIFHLLRIIFTYKFSSFVGEKVFPAVDNFPQKKKENEKKLFNNPDYFYRCHKVVCISRAREKGNIS